MKKKVHLKDIAKEANVSTAMVSYVLNGKLSNRINEKTAERIKKIAADLNYKPNRLAQSLKTNRTYNIGLVLPDLSNPFFSRLSVIVENKLKSRGYTVFIGSVEESNEKFKDMIDTFSERNVDGLILLPLEESYKEIVNIHSSTTPYVLIDRYYEDTQFNYVVNDNSYGIHQLVKYLSDKGKKNIGLITTSYKMAHIKDRNNGFIEACEQLPVDNWMLKEIELGNLKEHVYNEMENMLNSEEMNLDAIIFGSDVLALYGLGYMIKHDISVPKHIEIVAFDEAEYYNIFPSKFTYYRQPIEQMGEMAVSFLLSKIEKVETKPIQIMLKGKLLST